MRTPRSNFVVEYKTNRRQTKGRPTSIWGNLDLRAVARAVEADGSMPAVDLPQVSSVMKNVAAIKLGEAASDVQVDADGSSTAIAPPLETLIEPVTVESNGFNAASSAKKRPASTPARASKSRAKSQARTQHARILERPAMLDRRRDPFGPYGSEEELAALEAENHHLKRLMFVRLREENDRLKVMLRRFGGA
jgi:hypothetical protein